MSKIKELEEIYLRAKSAYYNEQPIMDDSAFDELEKQLVELNSKVVNVVGSWDRKAKYKHPTRMQSLEKIQCDKITGEAPIDDFIKWLDSRREIIGSACVTLRAEQKLDGNAVNLVYENGKIKYALSRGDGNIGRDYLGKFDISQIPTIIPIKDKIVEVRCEAVIDKNLFEKKYAEQFKNERNYVAGILNSDDVNEEQKNEIELVPVDVRYSDINENIEYKDITEIKDWGFKNYNELNYSNIIFCGKANDSHAFNYAFCKYDEYKRYISRFRIDGMVLKFLSEYRNKIGEVEHHPKWAIAVKFKPDNCSTEVIGFEIEMGKTGNFTPVAVLKPVDLDGSTVSRASAYNYDFIQKNKLNIGSIVSLVKSGDIIPQIISVDVPSTNGYEDFNTCPYCGSNLEIVNGKHIHCPNEDCNGKKLQKYLNAVSILKIYGSGEAFYTQIFDNVSDNPFFLFDKNIETILKNHLKNGKILDNFITNLKEIKELSIEQVIGMMSLNGISNDGKTIREIAKKVSDVPYSFVGLEKEVVKGWDKEENKYTELMEHIEYLKNNDIAVKFIKKPKENVQILKLTLTGSPKEHGFQTKSKFKEYLVGKGFHVEEVSIKDCDYLVTDNLNSTSSKMKNAQKLGKIIKTYSDF